MKTILITGGCGFIGHHIVEHIHRHTTWSIIILDKLSYASKGLERLRSTHLLNSPRIRMFTVDLCLPMSEGMIYELGTVHYILHMAADTHVDQSIAHPVPLIHNNVMSTVHLLEFARQHTSLERFFYFSTDEVYGAAPDHVSYKETDRHHPTNPYSASKSAAEMICLAYENTYRIPILIVNVMNAFGERQHLEKFIPKCIDMIQRGACIDIHANPTCQSPGSRFYIHARNIASAVLFLIHHGLIGEIYHIRGEEEIDNLTMARMIADTMQCPLHYRLVNFHETRPGHDLRYSLDGSKLETLGWTIPVGFHESLKKTIQWTLDHPEWLRWTSEDKRVGHVCLESE